MWSDSSCKNKHKERLKSTIKTEDYVHMQHLEKTHCFAVTSVYTTNERWKGCYLLAMGIRLNLRPWVGKCALKKSKLSFRCINLCKCVVLSLWKCIFCDTNSVCECLLVIIYITVFIFPTWICLCQNVQLINVLNKCWLEIPCSVFVNEEWEK